MGDALEKLSDLFVEGMSKVGEQGTSEGKISFSYAGRMARTANSENLKTAERMEKQGVDAEEIRRKTGWFRGMDKQWRFEIDDSKMEFRRDGDARLLREPEYRELQELTERWADGALNDAEIAEMEQLQDKYRDRVWEEKYMLRDFVKHDELFEAYPRLNGVGLVFDDLPSGTNGSYDRRSNTIILSTALLGSPNRTLLHEIQHVIQRIEGFAKGSSPAYWNEKMEQGFSKKWRSGEEMMPSELYRNTAGEIEARDTAARLDLTADERKAFKPDLGDENTVFAEGGNSSFEYVGKTADDVEVYETSKNVRGMTYKQRMGVFMDIMRNEYVGRTAKFSDGNNIYYAKFDEADLKKNVYGDKKSDRNGWKAKINTGADGNIFELVENARYSRHGVENGKTSGAHRDVTGWEYFVKTVQIDGKVYDLLANVRKKPDGEYVYSIQLNENKNKAPAPLLRHANHSEQSQGDFPQNRVLTNASADSIPTSSGNVNKRFSMQERGTSNREILTTALESAAQNPREREVLAEYKAAADKLETYEARLRENRAKVIYKASPFGGAGGGCFHIRLSRRSYRCIFSQIPASSSREGILDSQPNAMMWTP